MSDRELIPSPTALLAVSADPELLTRRGPVDRLASSQAPGDARPDEVDGEAERLALLLRETHHRIKNNLQIVCSLISLQSRYFTDAAAAQMFSATQDRIHAIALVHDRLHRSADLTHVDFCDYAAALVHHLSRTYRAAERGIERELAVTRARLPVDRAIPCGLLAGELITNALRHGFPDGRRGTVRVTMECRAAAADELELLVQDDGVGLPAGLDPSQSGTLGLDLVYLFAEQLRARVAVESAPGAGTSFRLRFSSGVQGETQACK